MRRHHARARARLPIPPDRDDPAGRDDLAFLNPLVVPAGKPVIIYLTSKDVIHSLGIPVYRIKQDAVPGLMSPVWFIPEKTTGRIRDEMAADFSVSKAVSTEGTNSLPAAETIDIRNGSAPDDRLALTDVADAAGVTLLSAGDGIDDEGIRGLLAAGITSVRVRRAAGIHTYVTTREYADRSGTPASPSRP